MRQTSGRLSHAAGGYVKTKAREVIIRATADEYNWLAHAADLRHLSVGEYVKRAINAQFCREGVDAVLFREREPRPVRSQD
jgi:hypothetical protein